MLAGNDQPIAHQISIPPVDLKVLFLVRSSKFSRSDFPPNLRHYFKNTLLLSAIFAEFFVKGQMVNCVMGLLDYSIFFQIMPDLILAYIWRIIILFSI